jgi:hypothetical protein
VSSLLTDVAPFAAHGLIDGAKLLAAAGIGVAIVLVQRRARPEQPLSRSMEQAHVLLCVAGALTMLIVGDSLPRAFGVAGAATIVRFRTPIDDPRDVTVLFLLMALGMATGLGLAMVAAVGTLAVSVCIVLMQRGHAEAPRTMKVALVAEGRQFPATHVSSIFAAHQISVEPIEFSHGDKASVRYRALLHRETSLDAVSAELLGGAAAPALASVSWEAAKKSL